MENQQEGQQHVASPAKIVLDFLLLMCVGFPILFLYLWAEPFHRGFFCSDLSIRHPYHDSTVPSIYLFIVGIFINVIVMTVTEVLNKSPYDEPKFVRGWKIPVWVCELYRALGIFLFGCAAQQLTTDVMKYTIGRLRPHFYSLCKPSYNCTPGSTDYVTDFTCTNPEFMNNRRLMKEMRLSFPSGHSSFSMYTMLYFAIYLQARMTWNGSKLLKHVLQFLAVLVAIFTGMSRVSDYKHHWSDVLVGLSIGAVYACLVARYASDLFNRRKHHIKVPKSTSTEVNNLNGNRSLV